MSWPSETVGSCPSARSRTMTQVTNTSVTTVDLPAPGGAFTTANSSSEEW
jgi:hypothetical protein